MSDLLVNLHFRDNSHNLAFAIARLLAQYMDGVISRALPSIQSNFHDLVVAAVRSAPEARSLIDGKLRGDMGLVDPAGAVRDVAEAVAKSVVVKKQKVNEQGLQLAGGLTVEVLRRDLSDIEDVVDSVRYLSSGKYQIDWLRWLLTRSSSPSTTSSRATGPFSHIPGPAGASWSRAGPGRCRRSSPAPRTTTG